MKQPEVIIIGGGLAGLTAAIHLRKANIQVRLFEKERYPHHKVCGEYLSREILPYLNSLGVNLKHSNPVEIDTLQYSDHNGRMTSASLPLGGLGISRFELDNLLYLHAVKMGVKVCNDTVTAVEFKNDLFQVESSKGIIESKFVLGAHGKRSQLDKKLKRDFISRKAGWLAIKGHYENNNYPVNIVSLHNFEGGYCGLSRTETGAVNVCYLASYRSFKNYGNPEKFKKEVLCQNAHLEEFFKNSKPLFARELSIAQISFDPKDQIHDHIIMIGDSAGLIHPLCGNGMAMAIHSAKIASECILKYFKEGNYNRNKMERSYIKEWKRNFSSRLRMGRILQRILLDKHLANISQQVIYKFPYLLPAIIKRTHGKKVL